ncbi:MAG: cation diffusion facilitator family transporter [Syntrophomonadaceae bacterium]|nr:cation diffusion facilitator family transporter [Syntrophomonadaceae bacterium]MDD3023352.1 cation diffusion facilitator family transporter [Syntrophomonadaceae bacterium]
MHDFLLKFFIRNYEDVKNPNVREQYGKLGGIVGIVVNVFLFIIKFAVGTWSHSVSIIGDAVNNLSDAGSSVISLISFKMSNKPPDKDHPFGHARIEYIASSIVGFLILLIGWELIKTSFEKILHPSAIEFSIITVFVLGFSILAKLWLYRLNTNLGKRINSSVMNATAADSLADVTATSAVLASTIISPLIEFQLDGYMGVAVAIFIMISAIKILKEMLDSLLGRMPSSELINMIVAYIKKYPGVLGIHDLVVHDYGPHRCFASVHVEVDARVDVLESHDLIDNIERDISAELDIPLVIHMDPIVIDDPFVNQMHQLTEQVIKMIDTSISMHDFRVVKGATHSNIIFDVTIPFNYKKEESQIIEEITRGINEINKNLNPVITIDRSYIEYSNV